MQPPTSTDEVVALLEDSLISKTQGIFNVCFNCNADPDDQEHCPQPCAAFTQLTDIMSILIGSKEASV